MGNWNRVILWSAGELSAWWPKLAAAATRDMADVSATLSTCQDDATRVAGDDRVVASERGMRLVADVPRETSLRMAARVCPRGGAAMARPCGADVEPTPWYGLHADHAYGEIMPQLRPAAIAFGGGDRRQPPRAATAGRNFPGPKTRWPLPTIDRHIGGVLKWPSRGA